MVVRINWGHCTVIFGGVGGLRKYCIQPPLPPPLIQLLGHVLTRVSF